MDADRDRGSHRPSIAFYGDDFTGATDTLATAAEAGLRTLLFLGVPDDAQRVAAGPLDVFGIAGAARSMAPDAMRAELAPVARCFAALAPRVVHYKVCSTFDSAPDVGNIAVAVDALSASVDQRWTAIVGGQPSLGRHCVFAHLFARDGPGGEVLRIDRHPMSRHPITPMREADLRVHLAAQGLADVRSLAGGDGAAGLGGRLRALLDAGARTVLFDVRDGGDLAAIGTVLGDATSHGSLLVVGASSVCEALAPHAPSRVADDGERDASLPSTRARRRPVLVHAGSLSPVTARQVAAATSYDVVRIDAARLAASEPAWLADVRADVIGRLRDGRHVIVCTVAADQAHASSHAAPGAAPVVSSVASSGASSAVSSAVSSAASSGDAAAGRRLAEAGGRLLASILDACPLDRIGFAGGDTSSIGVGQLDAWGLAFVRRIGPGVALCALRSRHPHLDGIEVMLKGGQMGPLDVFERLVAAP